MTASMCAGDVARELGMSFVSGDPSCNLVSTQPSRGLLGWFLSTTPLPYSGPATEIIARGQFDHRPTELYFYMKLRAGWRIGGLVGREMHVTRKCHLSLAQRVPTGDFELMLRHPPPGGEVERALPALPAASFGHPPLDQRYELYAAAPGVAYGLSRAVGVLDGQMHVHIVGQAGRIAMSFPPGATSDFAGAPRAFLQKLDAFTRELESSARSFNFEP